MLWMMWAAKEAVFKIIRKRTSGAIFAHRSYEVFPPSEPTDVADASAALRVRGSVSVHHHVNGASTSFPVEWEVTPRLVHCLAVSDAAEVGSTRAAVSEVADRGSRIAGRGSRIADGGSRIADRGSRIAVEGDWSDRELLSARTAESRDARLLAKRLAFDAGLGPVEIVRHPGAPRMGPPLLYAAGEAVPLEGWDLTLSHDGNFVAAALCFVTPD